MKTTKQILLDTEISLEFANERIETSLKQLSTYSNKDEFKMWQESVDRWTEQVARLEDFIGQLHSQIEVRKPRYAS